ncbi:MAG: indole-3-glycerol phosphate synthase TrpC [Epsilonproteobacteria bacterium]|nr:indole-3-glycerol phosphate synthase TrpC [Campylobacterota bacterium]
MILDTIIKKTKENLKKDKPIEELLDIKREIKDVKKFLKSTDNNKYRIIAEVKKASPSKGVIKEDFDPIAIAKAYNQSADAMSVLTEPFFFQGSLEYLREIAKFSNIPLLRKDFIIDIYQIAQAYNAGADFVLLIAKALDDDKLKELYDFARKIGLEVLFEIHDKEDLKKALRVGADIIGFNHRDLKTFQMNMNLSKELMPLIPKDAIKVAESGISSAQQIKELHNNGVDAFLIGEYFMRQNDIKQAVLDLKNGD